MCLDRRPWTDTFWTSTLEVGFGLHELGQLDLQLCLKVRHVLFHVLEQLRSLLPPWHLRAAPPPVARGN